MLKAIVNSPIRSGDQTINNGNLVIGTAGQGIDFSANTHAAGMTSEILTWYEEGTWTPALTFSIPGDLAVTYSIQVGRYTRIGRQVFITGDIETSAFTHTTASGNLRMSGLPFTSASVAGLLHAGSCSAAGYTATANMVTPIIQNNVAFIIFQISNTGSVLANLTTANIASGTQQVWRVSASYVV